MVSSDRISCITWYDHHPDVHVTVLDALTYAGNPENIAGHSRGPRGVGAWATSATRICWTSIVPGHDAIVHYAAESHNDNSIADPEPFLRTNVEGTFRLLEAARKYGIRYHHVSTDEVYGDLALDDPAKFTEHTPVPSVQPVFVDEGRERTCWCARGTRTYGIRATISQLQQQLRALTSMWRSSSRARSRTSWTGCVRSCTGKGLNVRDWIHTEDHSSGVWTILTKGRVGETYLIGADGERNNITVLRMILNDDGPGGGRVRLGQGPSGP